MVGLILGDFVRWVERCAWLYPWADLRELVLIYLDREELP